MVSYRIYNFVWCNVHGAYHQTYLGCAGFTYTPDELRRNTNYRLSDGKCTLSYAELYHAERTRLLAELGN